MDDVLVIGGGAAGIVAAWRAACLGARTRLLEKNSRLGLKIHISGGGKCNITQGGGYPRSETPRVMESLRRAFTTQEARFLRPAFLRFTNEDLLDLIRARGVGVHTRPDGRVFPDSGRADDVVGALEWHLGQAGARIELQAPATGLALDGGRIRGAWSGGHLLAAKTVIVAVGGLSYPKTGTTGDGYRWLRDLGHTIIALRPALAPVYLEGDGKPEWSGVALRNCLLRARQSGKEIARWQADLLYTHQGISGPAVLGISRRVARAMERGPATLDVDLLPELAAEGLAAQIASAHASEGRRPVLSLARKWLPERLAPDLLRRAGIDAATPLNQLSRKNRNRLVETVKRWDLGRARAVPLERGEVTAGGVALDEVDPATMASRVVPNLYLCGEILDIAGPVGGYNLQAAFSTGYVAGESAARA
jgi:predicted Rossmann fold flavoprotein